VLAGCGGDASPTQPPQATAGTAPEAPAAPPGKRVRFEAADGEPVTATYTAAAKDAPAVVLLHELRGGPDEWDELVAHLHGSGFATLAYQSRSSVLEGDRLPDALGAVRWLRTRPDVDPDRIALVGASIGASTAVLALATGARRSVDAGVALSPPESADIWSLQDHHRYRPHDLLLISDERESAAADSMLEGAISSRAMRSSGSGHGVALLREQGVRDALLAWLKTHLD
jgi:hypothetical protein